jgi:hypothetical protein
MADALNYLQKGRRAPTHSIISLSEEWVKEGTGAARRQVRENRGPGDPAGGGRPIRIAEARHGASQSPCDGCTLSLLRVISLVLSIRNEHHQKENRGSRIERFPPWGTALFESHLEQKVGPARALAPPACPRLPLTPNSLHRHHLSRILGVTLHGTPPYLAERASAENAEMGATDADYDQEPARLPVNRRALFEQLERD